MPDPYTHVVLLTHIGASSAESIYPFFSEDDAQQFVTLMGDHQGLMLDIYSLSSPIEQLDPIADWHGDVEIRDRAERFIDYLQSREQS